MPILLRFMLGAPLILAGCYTGIDDGGGQDSSSSGPDPSSPEDDDGGDFNGPSPGCETRDVGRTPLRRLTREQYDNTVRDLLGVTGHPAAAIESDERIGPFYSNAVAPVASLTVEQYMQVAEELAASVASDLDAILPCDPSSDAGDESACAETFIDDFGPRAYRRPLTADERARFIALYEQGRADAGFGEGIRLVVQLGLQSPHFLYHVEETGEPIDDGLAALDAYSLASRVSYFLWGSMPDDFLFEAAGSGALATADGLEAEVRRLLADPKAKDAIASFHLQWFGVSEIGDLEKDPAAFPDFDPALAEAMREETARFVNYVIEHDDGRLSTLLTASYSLLDPVLAQVYGVELAPGHRVDDPVELEQRAGLLTQPSVLATHAHANQTSPVKRGVFVRENLLCQALPPPPPDVDNTPPLPDPDATTRERYAQHREDPACAGCHALIDDLGLGFEHYDAIGIWRDNENDIPVDATGLISGTDVDGEFDGAVELAERLASSETVEACTVEQWFRFGLGRTATQADDCVVEGLAAKFRASDGDVEQLMVSIATSDAFRYRRIQ